MNKKKEDIKKTKTDKNLLIEELIKLENKKKNFGITTAKIQPHQEQLFPAIMEKIEIGRKILPKNKYILFQGGNGSGKSFIGLYATALLAMGRDCEKYNLPYIGSKRDIRIVTKSGSNVDGVIIPYLTGEYSKVRIPPEMIKSINNEKMIITLTNGSKISIKTYDQGYERLQGGNPDFLLIDEEPVKEKVWNEILMRGRTDKTQILITMTPLNGLTPVYRYFYEQQSEEVKFRSKVFLVSSYLNKFADHTALEGLSEQDKKMRAEGLFVPPSGLVYPSFNKMLHMIEINNINNLGELKYYGAVDFGVTHPMAFLFIGVDGDGNIIILDEIYQSGLLLDGLVQKIREKKSKWNIREFEYIIADTAAKRERTELKALGINTIPADKFSKGEKNESNRKAGILKVNKLFNDGKIYINNICEKLIKELEVHHYKENGNDGEVDKTNDDALDALRYWIFSYKIPKTYSHREKRFINTYGYIPNKNHMYLNNNNPY